MSDTEQRLRNAADEIAELRESARTHRENLLRALKTLVREERISASRAREVAGVSADYWREFVRSAPGIDASARGYIEHLPGRERVGPARTTESIGGT